jgi:transposase
MAAPATCPVALCARIRRCRFAHPLPIMVVIVRGRSAMETQTERRCIGLDVHREFAQVAIWQGGLVTQAGRFATTPEGVRGFAEGLGPADEVALEATGNTWAIATLLASRAGRVVVSNPVKTRAIAEAKVKTDKVDAEILAQLLAADYLPAVWRPDPAISALRRQVLRRAHIVRQRTRLKNQVHAILHRNLIARCPAADLFGHKGRAWLAAQQLPPDELVAATALLRQLDFHGQELRLIDTDLGQVALARPEVLRLMTVPGIDATVALSIVAAVGDFTRFRTPEKSGGQPASHGRITKTGPSHARGMLVEAA